MYKFQYKITIFNFFNMCKFIHDKKTTILSEKKNHSEF